jgi:hypothetical protein
MAILIGTSGKRKAWVEWLDHCLASDGQWSNPMFFGKTIGGVPTPAVDAYMALEMALRATGYAPRSAWAYNFRGISGAACSCGSSINCSLHGSGIAIDIDPTLNPYIATSVFRWSDTAFTPEQIKAVEAIRNTKGEQVWEWGGRWNSVKDYMHFELQVDPGSVTIDWTTVAGYGGGTEDKVFYPLTKTSAPQDIGAMQDKMVEAGLTPAGFKTDSIWGPATAAVVKEHLFQFTAADEDAPAGSDMANGYVVNYNMGNGLDRLWGFKLFGKAGEGAGVDSVARQAAAGAQAKADSAHALATTASARATAADTKAQTALAKITAIHAATKP